jgi:hypothetical protein
MVLSIPISICRETRALPRPPWIRTHAFVFGILRDPCGRHRLGIERHAVRLDHHYADIFHDGDNHIETVVDFPQKIDIIVGREPGPLHAQNIKAPS